MAAFTNTGADVVQRLVAQGAQRAASLTLEEMYEIIRCVAWVKQGGYHKVSNLLHISSPVFYKKLPVYNTSTLSVHYILDHKLKYCLNRE